MRELTQDKLKQVLKYDPEAGDFIRLYTRNGYYQGEIAGTTDTSGYIRVQVVGKQYLAHRLAWLYMTGEWPGEIDHLNHMRDDNRFHNLRSSNHADNCKNKSCYTSNNSGVNGVHFRTDRNKWQARTCVEGKRIHIGYFDSLKAAAIAKRQVDNTYGYHNNHGNT